MLGNLLVLEMSIFLQHQHNCNHTLTQHSLFLMIFQLGIVICRHHFSFLGKSLRCIYIFSLARMKMWWLELQQQMYSCQQSWEESQNDCSYVGLDIVELLKWYQDSHLTGLLMRQIDFYLFKLLLSYICNFIGNLNFPTKIGFFWITLKVLQHGSPSASPLLLLQIFQRPSSSKLLTKCYNISSCVNKLFGATP